MGQRPYKPDTANMKAIVRMATFVPPEKYTEIKQIRRILIAAQERKAPSAEFRCVRARSLACRRRGCVCTAGCWYGAGCLDGIEHF